MSFDLIDSDLNEFTPSLLNPRSEKMDTASQINRRFALSLKKKPLNKRRDSAKIYNAENIKAEIENMKNLPKIDENLNYVNPSQSQLNSQNVDATLATSQVIFKYPQNIKICKKCQFPSPTNLHQINCAGPAVNRPECEKREKCYSGISNHYLKYKHTILAIRNAEICSKSASASGLITPILSQTEVADSADKSKDDNYDICDAPTQIIHNDDYTSKSIETYFDEDIFEMPTQKLISRNVVTPKSSLVITTATITAGFIDGVGPEVNLKYGKSRREESVEDSLSAKRIPKSNVILLTKNSSTKEWESFRYGTPRPPKIDALKPTEKASSNSIQQSKVVSENSKKTAKKRSLENNIDTAAEKLVKTTNTNESIKPPGSKSKPDKEFVLQKWFSSFAKYEERQRNLNLMSKSKRNEKQTSKTVYNKSKEQKILNNENSCDVDAETVILEDPQILEEKSDASSGFEKAYPVLKELLPGGRKDVSKTVDTLKTSTHAAAVASSSHKNNSDYFSMSDSDKSNEPVEKSILSCRHSEEVGSVKLVVDGVYGRMVFNAEVTETGWKNVSVEGTKNLVINNNDLKQCNCNRNMEAYFSVKDKKCKGKVEKQRNDLQLEEKLKILVDSKKKKSEEEADSDVEIIEWESKRQSNLDRIISEAKSCGLNLDFPIYVDSEDDDNIGNEKNRRKSEPRSELKKKLRTQQSKSCSIKHKKPIF